VSLLLVATLALTAAARSGGDSISLGRALTFVDADGDAVRTSDFPGKWLLVYFGYTHCADLCPTGLSVLVNALDQIGPTAQHIQPLFITVDPERD
jgi:cytochrome oxidase Cu insertion factor (SCO1/SenC/PrrC family)